MKEDDDLADSYVDEKKRKIIRIRIRIKKDNKPDFFK